MASQRQKWTAKRLSARIPANNLWCFMAYVNQTRSMLETGPSDIAQHRNAHEDRNADKAVFAVR